jgi:hypothetical protein
MIVYIANQRIGSPYGAFRRGDPVTGVPAEVLMAWTKAGLIYASGTEDPRPHRRRLRRST